MDEIAEAYLDDIASPDSDVNTTTAILMSIRAAAPSLAFRPHTEDAPHLCQGICDILEDLASLSNECFVVANDVQIALHETLLSLAATHPPPQPQRKSKETDPPA